MGLINRLRDAFYNTTNETGEDLSQHRERAISQEEAIESLYRSHPDRAIGPWQVEKLKRGSGLSPASGVLSRTSPSVGCWSRRTISGEVGMDAPSTCGN